MGLAKFESTCCDAEERRHGCKKKPTRSATSSDMIAFGQNPVMFLTFKELCDE